jgi:hypothetical protein
MPEYSLGKIYKIYSPGNPSLTYVGSTIQPLSVRFGGHKREYKRYKKGKCNYTTSFKIFDESDDYKIELIENVPCDSKEQLLRAEGKYIKEMNCVNKRKSWRSEEDNKKYQRQYHRQYNQLQKEKIKERINKPYTCVCGRMINSKEKPRHSRTKIHIDFILDDPLYHIASLYNEHQ